MAEGKKPAKKAAKPAAAKKQKGAAKAKSKAPARVQRAAEPDPANGAPRAPKAPSEKTIKVTQIGSPIGRQGYQRATLKGLGLNKMHRSRILEDTPAVRGMIEAVKHLVRVDAAS